MISIFILLSNRRGPRSPPPPPPPRVSMETDSFGGAASLVGPATAEDQGEGHAAAAGPEAGAVPARV